MGRKHKAERETLNAERTLTKRALSLLRRPLCRLDRSAFIVPPFVLLCVCVFSAALSPASRAQERQAAAEPPLKVNKLLAVGTPAPDWTLTDAAGAQHKLSAYRGRVVVLDFWATWCGPCAELMPRMQKLHERYGARGVVVFGVNAWEQNDPTVVMRDRRLTYGLLLKGEEIARTYGIINLPVVYVIGADGRVVYRREGVEGKDLGGIIEKQLKTGATP